MTHLEFFHLTEEPFSNLPDTGCFFSCVEHAQALDLCMAALAQAPYCAIVTAGAGMGKTMIAHRFAELLPPETWRAMHLIVPHAALSPRALLGRICGLLDGGAPPPRGLDGEALLDLIGQQLDGLCREGKQAVLIVDEAQMLEDREAIAVLGRLCARQAEGLPHLALIFFGLPACVPRLSGALGLAALGQIPHHLLEALFPATVAAYVQHRLTRAGATANPFTSEALDALHRLSGGAPRRINQLCEASLFEAARAGRRDIDHGLLEYLSPHIEPAACGDVLCGLRPGCLADGAPAEDGGLAGGQLEEIDRFLGSLLEG